MLKVLVENSSFCFVSCVQNNDFGKQEKQLLNTYLCGVLFLCKMMLKLFVVLDFIL